jgi:uncharacterized protein YciI
VRIAPDAVPIDPMEVHVFIILLRYVKPLGEVDRLLDQHGAYLERNYAAGHFLVSGRRVPRTGGVILARGSTIAEIEAVVSTDPFITEGVATSEVIEFEPGRWADGFGHLRPEGTGGRASNVD